LPFTGCSVPRLPGFFFGLRLRGIFAALESNHHGTAERVAGEYKR
jgi:hypothetical protein